VVKISVEDLSSGGTKVRMTFLKGGTGSTDVSAVDSDTQHAGGAFGLIPTVASAFSDLLKDLTTKKGGITSLDQKAGGGNGVPELSKAQGGPAPTLDDHKTLSVFKPNS